MKAIVCTAYGGPDVLKLQNVEKPVPDQDDIQIKTHASTVATAGLMSRKGKPIFTRFFSGL